MYCCGKHEAARIDLSNFAMRTSAPPRMRTESEGIRILTIYNSMDMTDDMTDRSSK